MEFQTDVKQSAPLLMKWSGSSEAEGLFTGYASTFSQTPDSYGDLVRKGAFADSLALHRERGTLPAMLWGHDQTEPIGKFIDLEENDHGLFVRGRLELDLDRGRDAYVLARNDVLALSIGYRLEDYERGKNGTTILTKIDLVEISLTATPANHEARLTSVKSAIESGDIRTFEREVRDALRLSARQVKALLAGGWKSLARDGADDDREELKSLLLAHGQEIRTATMRNHGY
jgi:HK97 family phage prohead protease